MLTRSTGIAASSLLDSYNVERQPVGKSVVVRANTAIGLWNDIWNALGLLTPDVEARKSAMDELQLATPAGLKRREAFNAALKGTRHEFHGLGIEMGQAYTSSAVYLGDEDPKDELVVPDPVWDYVPSTRPGRRLPHVWLNKAVPEKLVSTQDLAGKGAFCLFIGTMGRDWRIAAASASVSLKIPINVYSVGYRQDWEDVYMEWGRVRGVDDSGCVLVRPDRFVAWRSRHILESIEANAQKLSVVLKAILGMVDR